MIKVEIQYEDLSNKMTKLLITLFGQLNLYCFYNLYAFYFV